MDAACTIQDSIHVFSLVHKYVSRILGTYHSDAGVILRKKLLQTGNRRKNQQEKYFLKIALSFPKKRPINRLDSRNANHFKEERRCRYAYRSL